MMDSRARLTAPTQCAPAHIAHGANARADTASRNSLFLSGVKDIETDLVNTRCAYARVRSVVTSEKGERNLLLAACAQASGLCGGGEEACELPRPVHRVGRSAQFIRPGRRPQAPLDLPMPGAALDARVA